MSNEAQKISWPGWKTVKMIGRGSFGAVYEIQRDVFGETEKAALKVISIPQSNSDIEELRDDGYDDESITNTFKSHLKSIVAEYSLMKKLNSCNNVVYCDDVRYIQHDDGIGWDIFIKMELLTPFTKIPNDEISEDKVVKLAGDVCNALIACKKFEVVHRDIKPQNIFVSENGDYKLGDFGIAKTVERTMGGTKIGTYKYMAPEVYNNQPYGSAADIYSLGLVLYWLLNERRMPFLPQPPEKLTVGMEEKARARRFSGEPLPPPVHGSEDLKNFVLKACAYDPKDRFASASEMLGALKLVISGNKDESDEAETVNPAKELNATAPIIVNAFNKHTPETEDTVTIKDRNGYVENNKLSKDKKKKLISTIGTIALLVVALVAVLLSGTKGKLLSDSNSETSQENNIDSEEDSTIDLEISQESKAWSDWTDKLPKEIKEDKYDIETKTLYRSRTVETTTSTKNKMDGWELYDTVSKSGGYGPWSNWSQTKPQESSNREIDKPKTMYRYRKKETTTSNKSSMDGWTLENTTYSWSEYGDWSDWSTTSVSNSDSKKVESKTQYRSRSITTATEYTDWGSWSAWQDQSVSSNDLRKVETRTVYAYYYYKCPNCGAHMHGWNITCPKWAGGCGVGWIKSSDAVIYWSTTPHNSVNFADWHGTGHYYAYVDGILVFKWGDGMARGEAVKTQYRYATRSTKTVTKYGDWSNWTDNATNKSSSLDVETRTAYRYCERKQIPTYYYSRWGAWSEWNTTPVSSSDDKQVDSQTFYRYRDKVDEKTYYFRRYGEWSDYKYKEIKSSDSLEVESKTQYRYKLK